MLYSHAVATNMFSEQCENCLVYFLFLCFHAVMHYSVIHFQIQNCIQVNTITSQLSRQYSRVNLSFDQSNLILRLFLA